MYFNYMVNMDILVVLIVLISTETPLFKFSLSNYLGLTGKEREIVCIKI